MLGECHVSPVVQGLPGPVDLDEFGQTGGVSLAGGELPPFLNSVQE